jgi:hypothetical protein
MHMLTLALLLQDLASLPALASDSGHHVPLHALQTASVPGHPFWVALMAEALDSTGRQQGSLHPLTFLSPEVITRVWKVGGRAGRQVGNH